MVVNIIGSGVIVVMPQGGHLVNVQFLLVMDPEFYFIYLFIFFDY